MSRSASAAAGERVLDGSGFRSFYDQWVEKVAQWIKAMGCPTADQDDLIQEVFVVAYRRLPYFDGSNPAAWLYRIAFHKVRDFRRLRWIKHVFGSRAPLTKSVLSTDVTPLGALEDSDKRELLDRLLATLNETQRFAFVLFEVQGYTAEEIAQLQRVSINTVRARIHRARRKLLVLLRKGTDPPSETPKTSL